MFNVVHNDEFVVLCRNLNKMPFSKVNASEV